MKNNILILSFLCSVSVMAQNFYISPFLGIKADVNRNDFSEGNKYGYFQMTSPSVNFYGLSPLLLGFNLEYQRSKKIFGFGFVFDEQANSKTEIRFVTPGTDPYSGYKNRHMYGNYAGWPMKVKVPIYVKHELWTTSTPSGKKKFALNLNTGINLYFLKVKNHSRLENPMGFGAVYTEFGDKIEFVGYDGNNQKSFSLGFMLGLDFDFYVNNKRRFNAQLYFEQGTRVISNSAFVMYKNDVLQGGVGANSRGSAIQFKLAFPIRFYTQK